jgi:phospholipid transport system substrate-binding protein
MASKFYLVKNMNGFNNIKKIIFLAFWLSFFQPDVFAEVTLVSNLQPKMKVEAAILDIIKVVQEYPGDEKKDERRKKLREVIEPVFDFKEMARRSLGTYWNEITPEEQREFITVFSDLLARTYLSKVETVKPGMVKVTSELIEPTKAVVRTSVLNKGKTFPLDYRLQNSTGTWRVYDVVIESIGLVDNYRNEFSGIVRKEKFSGLLERLRNKKVD